MIEGCPHGPNLTGEPCPDCERGRKQRAETEARLAEKAEEATAAASGQLEDEIEKGAARARERIKAELAARCEAKHDNGSRCELEPDHPGRHVADQPTGFAAMWDPSPAERWRIEADAMRWGHAVDPDPEGWEGTFLTREAAIKDAVAEYADLEWVEVFYIGRGSSLLPSTFVDRATAAAIFERMAEEADEAVGLAAEEWPNEDAPMEDSLVAHIKEWADAHLECAFWMADGHVEEIQNPERTEVGCHQCHVVATSRTYRGATATPPGWFAIDEVGDSGGAFCSITCVDAFREEEARLRTD